MKIIEINNIILGNVELPKTHNYDVVIDYTNDILEAIDTFDGLYNKVHLQKTLSHKEFYESNPILDNAITDWYSKSNVRAFKKELFYSMVCGTYIPEVSTELTALFFLTKRASVSPNKMIAALDKSRMKKYLTQQFHPNKRVMKEVLDKIWGYDVQLLTELRPSVDNNGITEIYIDNINDVLICNNSIRNILVNTEDISKLWYSKEKGIVIGDKQIPLRTLIHPYGITMNDLDLREVLFS